MLNWKEGAMKFIKVRYSLEFKNDIAEPEAESLIEQILNKIEDEADIDCLYGMVKDNKQCWVVILTIQEGTYRECRKVFSCAKRMLQSSLKDINCTVDEDVVIEGERP